MEKRRVLERVSFGVYRFNTFPYTKLSLYMEAVLWPSGLRATISHGSALALYEISDVNPEKIHLCVPASHRSRRKIPQLYKIYREDLLADEVTEFDGIPVVTAQKAILQAYEIALGPALLAQAIEDGYNKGMLTEQTTIHLSNKLQLPSPVRHRKQSSLREKSPGKSPRPTNRSHFEKLI